MRKIFFIFFFLANVVVLKSQNRFETIGPGRPVIAGESFQIQFVIAEADKVTNFKAPLFNNLRFISGPNQYNGSATTPNGIIAIRNIVYTLEALYPGQYKINGAFAMINGKPFRSNDLTLEVIAKGKTEKKPDGKAAGFNADYMLRPGEDPYDKIRKNLFLKVEVDRKSCYAGEPVLAEFKLYSRLESYSDIVKNPGFYGFTVYDMINLADKRVNTEMLNGKLFDVHTIRKVQLFPLQAGSYTIDAMEVKNKIEFSRSMVSKKPEQEIIEGLGGEDHTGAGNENTVMFETTMHTDPVVIRVKPVPVTGGRKGYNGA
ncbi:MAG: BatD family protein, partial [Chitinophagaceae bacterium]